MLPGARSSLSFLAGAAALLVAGAPTARADEKVACAHASEQAQELRSQRKMTAARQELLTCARDVCPQIVRKDCVQWLGEVDAALPSVVVTARDAQGQDLVSVHVTVDGKPFTDTLDGKAIPIDPGIHAFHLETAGAASIDQQVVVREGEKNRSLAVTFGPPGGAKSSEAGATPPAAGAEPPPPPATHGGGPPVLTYVLGGVGVVAMGSFAFFGITGTNDASNLRSTCAPACSTSQVDSVRHKLLAADISLGVGVVAIGAAAVLWITHPSASASVSTGSTGPRLDLGVLPGGGMASLGGRFF